jgi:hypothetical protein
MRTQENNKMIAEFMGIVYPKLDNIIVIDNVVIKENELSYHKSWDWLMPVVSKCFKTGDDTYEWDNIMDTLFTCDIDIVYTQVVEFINEYNKNESTD